MSFRRLIATLPLACALTLGGFAYADDVQVNYEYKQKPQVDFSKPKGALKVSAFTDKRSGAGANQIGSDTAEKPVAEIVSDALVQSFVAGGATLVEDGQGLTLDGEVTEVSVAEKNGNQEVTIRAHVTLRAGSRTAFDTIIFGRAAAADIAQATRDALDKLVNSLILDDYFLMEVI
ncbi:MAG: hypothetical protein H7A05_10635 [Pseudomonadales bacterium]|nr:hypothetical protein [Pseudomonadales bacterium]MCP5345070.1 hypothetical protein [Pseudomonadales bacterium]